MKKMLLILVLIFNGTGSLAYDADCFDSFGKEGALLTLQIIQYQNVWPGYEKQQSVYAFSNGKLDQTVLVGAKENALINASIPYERCSLEQGIESFLIKDIVMQPENGLYDIRTLSSPGSDSIGRFVSTSSTPIIQIAIPNNYEFSHKQVARVAIHEGFHGLYQFSSGVFKIENPQSRDFLKDCRQIKIWNDSTIAQNTLLVQALKETDRPTLKTIWNKIKAMREKLSSHVSTKACLDSLRFWERIEGTAHFVETESSHKLGITSFEEIVDELKSELDRPELSDNFFYFSGDALLRIARSLDIDDWSEKVDKGTMIDLLQ